MSALTASTPTGTVSSARRVAALVAMELRLLVRSTAALVTAVAIVPLMAVAFLGVVDVDALTDTPGQFAGVLLTMLAAFALLFAVYYNITAAAVARREELMLKRLTSGEPTRSEVLVAMAAPAAVVVVAQILLGAVVLGLWSGGLAWTSPPLFVLALVGGIAVFALLAYATAGRTRNVEAAQLTTLPLFAVGLAFSGLFFPLDVLPEALQRVASVSPLAPVADLMRLSAAGIGPDGAVVAAGEVLATATRPLLVLVAWVVLGVFAVRRWMRWEPRR